MLDFEDLTDEMIKIAVSAQNNLSDLNFKFSFIKGKSIKLIDEHSISAGPIRQENVPFVDEEFNPIKIKNLIDSNYLVLMIYKYADFRPKVLGLKLGKLPIWGHKSPLFLIYFNDKTNCYDFFSSASAEFSEIAFPLTWIKNEFINTELIDLFGYEWCNIRQWDSRGKCKGIKKEHLFFSSDHLNASETWRKNLKSIFSQMSRISDSFMKQNFYFKISEGELNSIHI